MPIQADLALDPLTWDLAWPLRLITGLELIQQRIRVRLQRGLGEWFLAPDDVGLPLLDWRQQKPPRIQEIVSRIQAELRSIPGVLSVANFTGTHDAATRSLTIAGDVYADDGSVTSVVVVGAAESARNSFFFSVFFHSRAIPGTTPRPTSGRP